MVFIELNIILCVFKGILGWVKILVYIFRLVLIVNVFLLFKGRVSFVIFNLLNFLIFFRDGVKEMFRKY